MILALLASMAWATITIEAPPRPGEETVILVTDDAGRPRAGETVRVIHRPGLGGERELAVGITDARGRVRWTPQMDGVTVVRAGEERLSVRVTPAETPLGTVTLLVVLSLAALGSLGYGLVRPGPKSRTP